MMLYEVSNQLGTSLVIEDIGVTLQARGGSDSLKVITSNMRDSSSDLRKMLQLRWVSVSARPAAVTAAIPVWPLSLKRAVPEPVPVAHAPAAPAPAPRYEPPRYDVSSLADSVAKMDGRMAEILSLLKAGRGPADGPLSARAVPDPVFLPSKMVPDAEVRMTVASSETDSAGFDDSKEALSKLRRKK